VPPPAADLDDFNPYAPKRAKGKVIALTLGGTLLVLIAAVGLRTLNGGNQASDAAHGAVVPVATAVAVVPTPPPAESPLTAEPVVAPEKSAPDRPEPRETASRRTNPASPAKAKTKAKTKTRVDPGTTAARGVTRAPLSDPSPAAPRPASKGVIVRDAPF
jgi:hypothetical protein